MIALLLKKVAITLLLAIAGMAALEQFNPDPPQIVVELRSSMLSAIPVGSPIQANRGLLGPADLPAWRPPSRGDSRLFATCPVTPWALPRQSQEHAV